jgi:hypothetical protein
MVIIDNGAIMIYTHQMREAVRNVKPPHEFVVDIIEYDMGPTPFLGIRFYESQWEYYNEKERLDCVIYLEKIRKIIRSFGVNVTLDPVIDTGNSIPSSKKVRGKGVSK